MSKEPQENFETLGQAARRLLDRIDARKKVAGHLEAPAEIWRADLTGFDLGDFPAMDDITQTSPDTDERNAPEDRAAGATLRGFETASRMVRVRPLPEVVYVSWAGVVLIAANGNHADALARLALTSSRPKPKASP